MDRAVHGTEIDCQIASDNVLGAEMATQFIVDTLGDTFTGYFLAGLADDLPMEDVLRMSAKASSIAVTREGAVPSIPYRAEVMAALKDSF